MQGLPISPNFSPDTGQVVSKSGLGLAGTTEFVSSAKPANGEARNGTASAMAANIFNFFIGNVRYNDTNYTPVSENPLKNYSRDFQPAGVSEIQPIGGAMKRRPKTKRKLI